jgi:hypothetical protein
MPACQYPLHGFGKGASIFLSQDLHDCPPEQLGFGLGQQVFIGCPYVEIGCLLVKLEDHIVQRRYQRSHLPLAFEYCLLSSLALGDVAVVHDNPSYTCIIQQIHAGGFHPAV